MLMIIYNLITIIQTAITTLTTNVGMLLTNLTTANSNISANATGISTANTNVSSIITKTNTLVENRTAGFIGGNAATNGTFGTYNTVASVASACVLTGLSFSGFRAGATYTMRVTLDGVATIIPIIVLSTSSPTSAVNFSLPCILKCNISLKIEITDSIGGSGYSYAIAYAI